MVGRAVAGLPVSCRNCGAKLTVSDLWKLSYALVAVLLFVFVVAWSVRLRSFAPYALLPVVMAPITMLVARIATPRVQHYPPLRALIAWLGFVLFMVALLWLSRI